VIIPNRRPSPRVWTAEELREHAERALQEFVDRRLAEPRDRYRHHLDESYGALLRLFKVLSKIDPAAPDGRAVREILLDDELFDALRYVTAPPVSFDDLSVLVSRSTERMTKTRLRQDDTLPSRVLQLICDLSDTSRFPWVADRRQPRLHEVKLAVRATAALCASRALETERRGFGKALERHFERQLVEIGFRKSKAPNRARIRGNNDWPAPGRFYGECTVYGRKADLLIRIDDGRVVAVEAKHSSSVLNSVKRVLNDTAAKAQLWRRNAGEEIVPVALLSGVFGVDNLALAQDGGLFLVWAHDSAEFLSWLGPGMQA
jgi:hypothetical protein